MHGGHIAVMHARKSASMDIGGYRWQYNQGNNARLMRSTPVQSSGCAYASQADVIGPIERPTTIRRGPELGRDFCSVDHVPGLQAGISVDITRAAAGCNEALHLLRILYMYVCVFCKEPLYILLMTKRERMYTAISDIQNTCTGCS